jgi:hypothetical protein
VPLPGLRPRLANRSTNGGHRAERVNGSTFFVSIKKVKGRINNILLPPKTKVESKSLSGCALQS